MSWDDDHRAPRGAFGRRDLMSVAKAHLEEPRTQLFVVVCALFVLISGAVLVLSGGSEPEEEVYEPGNRGFIVPNPGIWHSIYQDLTVGDDGMLLVRETARKELAVGPSAPKYIDRFLGPRIAGPTAPKGRPIQIVALRAFPEEVESREYRGGAPDLAPWSMFSSLPGKLTWLQLPFVKELNPEISPIAGGAMVLLESEFSVKGAVWFDNSVQLNQMLWEPARALLEPTQSITALVKLPLSVTAFVAGVAITKAGAPTVRLTVDRGAASLSVENQRLEVEVYAQGVPEFRVATRAPLAADETFVVWATFVSPTGGTGYPPEPTPFAVR